MFRDFRAGVSPRALCAALGAAALAAVAQTANARTANTQTASVPATTVSGVVVTAPAADISDRPVGQTVQAISRDQFINGSAASIADVLSLTPGVTFVLGNGPRDVSISVRGSNARQTFGVRNVQVFEDGFPVTQPDGLARTDLTDPHAYGRIDVVQGPSSALYGNYATGGAVKFYTRTGREIDSLELGLEGGQDGYRNAFLAFGRAGDRWDAAVFASHVSGDGYREHTAYNTTTVNALATLALTDHDRLTVKFINNDTDTDLSVRLSWNQFLLNPYQQGCATLAAAGCASVSLFTNGFNGTRQTVSAEAAGLNRNDRRTIVGARWEHDFSNNLTSRLQLVWDNRDIKQPTSATSAVGTFPSFNLMGDITRHGDLFGHNAVLFAGVFGNRENINSYSYNVPASGTATLGGIAQAVNGSHFNFGARLHADVDLTDQLTLALGLGYERTLLKATQMAYTYPTSATPTIALVTADRSFDNVAPEVALNWRANEMLQVHARFGAGYGTPQATNLFITAAGIPGNNTQLDAQTMLGVDLGGDVHLGEALNLSVVGFYEWYRNELVSQSAGANLQNFTFNAPRSEHRGVEVALRWRPLVDLLPGASLEAAWLYNEQIYRTYVERLSAGSFSSTFDRSGNRIPGVAPSFLNVRAAYDQRSGPLSGLGGYVEWTVRDAAFMDNANLMESPGYTLVNANLHYDTPVQTGPFSHLRLYLSVQNLADEVYVGSASNVTNSISSTTGLQNGLSTLQAATGTIYAGAPRTVSGGLTVKF